MDSIDGQDATPGTGWGPPGPSQPPWPAPLPPPVPAWGADPSGLVGPAPHVPPNLPPVEPAGWPSGGTPSAPGRPPATDGYYTPPPPPPPGAVAPPDPRDGRRRRRLMVGALAAVMVLGAVAVALPLIGPANDAQAAAALTAAAQNSATAQTVTMNLSGQMTVQGNGQSATLTVSGSGQADYANHAFKLTTTYAGAGHPAVTASEIVVDGSAYISTQPGQWYSASIGDNPEIKGGQDPETLLHLLEAPGSGVVPLGHDTVDGQSVQGYRVSFAAPAIQRGLENEHLSPTEVQAAEQLLKDVSGSVIVYVGETDQRLIRLSVTVATSVDSGSADLSMAEDFSDYGAPVSITAPPPSQTVPLSQAAGGTGV